MKALLPAVLLATAAMSVPESGNEAARALREAQAAQQRSRQKAAQLADERDRGIATVARADRQSDTLARQLAAAEEGVRIARAHAAAAMKAEQAQEIRIARTRAPLAAMTAMLARIARRPPALALANGATILEAAHLSLLIRHMSERIVAQNTALVTELGRRTQLRDSAARAVAALEVSGRLLDQRRQMLAQSRQDLVEHGTILAEAADREGERLRGLEDRSAALGSAIGDSRRDQALAARLAGLPGPMLAPDAGSGAPKSKAGLYRLPRFGRVIAGTGERDADGIRARGLTLATAPGLSVVAPAAGHVIYAGAFRNYGDIVIIDHGRGWTSLVAGLSRSTAGIGDDLAQGAQVGRSAHRLLIELRHRGRPVDIVAMADLLQP